MLKKTNLFFLFLISLAVQSNVVTRSEVINMAQNYVSVGWMPLVDECNALNPPFDAYPPFRAGQATSREAYVWGGFDRYGGNEQYGSSSWPNDGLTFPERIYSSVCPGGFNTGQYGSPTVPTNLAGIDCSGYVTRCWGIETSFHPYNTTTLWSSGIALEVDYSELKLGDIIDNPGDHVVLYASGAEIGNWMVYEAIPPQIKYHQFPHNYYNYIPLSIFPQFSDESPSDGGVLEDSQTVNISLTIKASGTIVSGGVSMVVNGNPVSNPDLQPQGDNTWILTTPDFDVSKGGRFDVKVTARNDLMA